MLLREQLITPILLLLLAMRTYKLFSRELRTWKKLLSGTLVAAADPNPSQITSAHQNAPILKAKFQTNTVGKNHQKLDAIIRQCEQNFRINGCTRDKTRVAYAVFYCHGTPQTQWEEYERRPEHHHPNVITWDDMKKKLRRQLGEEHVYIDEMYDKWQRAAQRTNQTGKEFREYLQSIRSNLLDLDNVRASNENAAHLSYAIRH